MHGKEQFVYFYSGKLLFLKNTKIMHLDAMATTNRYKRFSAFTLTFCAHLAADWKQTLSKLASVHKA